MDVSALPLDPFFLRWAFNWALSSSPAIPNEQIPWECWHSMLPEQALIVMQNVIFFSLSFLEEEKKKRRKKKCLLCKNEQ